MGIDLDKEQISKFLRSQSGDKNNCSKHISQHRWMYRQSDNEIWSINIISCEKHVSLKIMQKMKQVDFFQISFYF